MHAFLKLVREGSLAAAVTVAMVTAPLAEAAPPVREDDASPAMHAAAEGAPAMAAGAAVAGFSTWSLVTGIGSLTAMSGAGAATATMLPMALVVGGAGLGVAVGVGLLAWGGYKAWKAYKAAKEARTPPPGTNPGTNPGGPNPGGPNPGDPTAPGGTSPSNPGAPGGTTGRIPRPGEGPRGPSRMVPPTSSETPSTGSNIPRNTDTRPRRIPPPAPGRSVGGASGAGTPR